VDSTEGKRKKKKKRKRKRKRKRKEKATTLLVGICWALHPLLFRVLVIVLIHHSH